MSLTTTRTPMAPASGHSYFGPRTSPPSEPQKTIRLSWPKSGDTRRSRVGESPAVMSQGRRGGHFADGRIIHVSHRDIEMHYHFTSSLPDMLARPLLDVPMKLNSRKNQVEHEVLFEYFRDVASKSLATFGYHPPDLGEVLIRIARVNNTPSAKAVMNALLAFSAIHRNDIPLQAAELKLSAINALVAVSGSGTKIGTTEAIQHVAAGMLLSSFEIHQSSSTSGEWVCYFRGVKHLVKASGLDKLPQNRELAILLDWVHYHDVMMRFSLRHWYRDFTGNPVTGWSGVQCDLASLPVTVRVDASETAPPAFIFMQLLSDICDTFFSKLPGTTPDEPDEDRISFLNILEWRIRNMPSVAPPGCPDAPVIMELYRLALLVYLNRASENLLDQEAITQQHIEKAFQLFPQARVCERQFPIFVLGCEARDDKQRAVVLDLIDRTEKQASSRSFDYVRLLLQAVWAQDDLSDGGIDYWDKMSYVISCCKIVPAFM